MPAEIEFATSVAVEEARERILSTIGRIGGRVKVDSPGKIIAGFGSDLKARLLGALLGGIESFPRDLVVELRTSDNTTQVKVSVRDTFGFGSRAGIANKIRKLMHDNALAIKSAFPDAK
ncbi:MAG: hypothetical protein JW715_13670 [Sedimentisphaerales bacterium]|nr:hypothetical protein [Sedimentisphaerales bacterium]